MARKRRLAVAGLNIRTDNHPAGTYEALLTAAFQLKRPVKYRGDQFIFISRLSKERLGLSTLQGTIGRFTNIDPGLDWFDTIKFDQASGDDLRELRIPESLKPNYTTFFFSFFPKFHIFVFEMRGDGESLSPRVVRDSFEELLNAQRLVSRFGEVTVDVVADREQLSHILGIKRLRKLTINIQRPNADDFGEYESVVQERLKKVNGRNYTEEYNAVRGETLKPDQEIRTHANVAMTNGSVVAVGRDNDGNPVKRSSLDHPQVANVRYDPDEMTHQQAFNRAASTFIEKP